MTPGELVRARLLISGRVQGVAYRQSAVEAAHRVGVVGWVRNLPDGRVEALAQGERRQVESLVAWCRRGPPPARVDDVQVAWEEARGDLASFDIRW